MKRPKNTFKTTAGKLPPHVMRIIDSINKDMPPGARVDSIMVCTPVTVRGKPKRNKPVDTRGRKK